MDIKSSTAPNGIQVTTAGARGAGTTQGAGGAQAIGGADRAGRNERAGAAGDDQVQLSSLGSAIEGLQPGSEAREARVESLRQVVAQGAYRVDANELAQQIITDSVTGE